jgi:hypothetical protein
MQGQGFTEQEVKDMVEKKLIIITIIHLDTNIVM